ncbi:hypothetical protein [Xanthomonas sp. 3058]|uniref:DUF7687 domain-containing protein n=1 Tax=Xanthomonas sp. 3058 TaxID=3035314 RepID=UPI0017AF8718|nr:hypothetical protein [Xanthomonas sp. 3058]MBB5866233.1 hypothetical protein [Xanthomonas sp. 3058]
MKQPQSFWALVRTLSEKLGYTNRAVWGAPRGSSTVKVHTVEQMAAGLANLGLNPSLVLFNGRPTELGTRLQYYFSYRACALINEVEPNLMDGPAARALFDQLYARVNPPRCCPIPMNKQRGAMAAPAFLTGLVNMLVYEAIGNAVCDYAPGQLTTFTRNGVPLRTLARRVDGAFPSAVNPIAVWEIKEYYYTTTFGSRVADGVYETLLDGLELDELEQNEQVRAEHVLIVDSHFTWWVCGKSYLCRMIDMLNMGLVSEVIFGREVVDRMPILARGWMEKAHFAQY